MTSTPRDQESGSESARVAPWQRPFFTASDALARIDLVVFTREAPPRGVGLGSEDGLPDGYDLPGSIQIRGHALAHGQGHAHDHGDFATYLRGPFREHANALLGPAASALDGAAHAVTISGSLPDPPSLAHLQGVRAFVRKLAREAGGIAAANLLALSWWDLPAMARAAPPASLDASEWLEVLFDEDERALYTRGMAQFARPDLALVGCSPEELEAGALLLRYLGELGAHGHWLRPAATVVLDEDEAGGARVDVRLTQLDAPLRSAIGLSEDALGVDGFHEALANA